MMDAYISRWILEFLLRQPIEELIINPILSMLPLLEVDHDHLLTKVVLLKRIYSQVSNALVSEKTLESLELIEQYYYEHGILILDSMKEAYCAVAVHCTVMHLKPNSDDCRNYFDAVIRIWRGRIRDMERWNKVALFSNRLKHSRDAIEEALWRVSIRDSFSLRDTLTDALKSLRLFLAEATEEMGPSFLEVAAKILEKDKVKQVKVSSSPLLPDQAGERQTCSADAPLDATIFSGRNHLVHLSRHMDMDSTKEIPPASKKTYNVVSTPDVRKVQETLKSSASDLQAVVKDPLPAALHVAATISSSNIAREETMDSLENQNVVHMDVCVSTVNEGLEAVHAKEAQNGNKSSVSRRSLMDKNRTAHTFEWTEDSTQSSSEGTPKRPHLCTPKRKLVSPLRNYVKKGTRRRKKFWTPEEEQALRHAIEDCGAGKWKLILTKYGDAFDDRTDGDLRDKWRNMIK